MEGPAGPRWQQPCGHMRRRPDSPDEGRKASPPRPLNSLPRRTNTSPHETVMANADVGGLGHMKGTCAERAQESATAEHASGCTGRCGVGRTGVGRTGVGRCGVGRTGDVGGSRTGDVGGHPPLWRRTRPASRHPSQGVDRFLSPHPATVPTRTPPPSLSSPDAVRRLKTASADDKAGNEGVRG